MSDESNRTRKTKPLRSLGGTGIRITPIGLGAWQFSGGKGSVGRFWPALGPELTRDIVRASLDGGINWFDTAEMYGKGESERALARALQDLGREDGDVVIATKWFPLMRTARSIRKTVSRRLKGLAPFAIDLHQVHHPMGFSSVEKEMAAMADLVEDGRIRSVGVSNYNEKQMRRAHAALRSRGLGLASNQMRYSLLDRRIESNGVLDAAQELGITIIAYSPLEQGVLSGKFHDDPSLTKSRPFRKWMGNFRAKGLARSKPLVDALRETGRPHDATAAQVALNWLVTFQGETVVAIPGATKVRHAEQNAGALDFELTRDELDRIDEASRECG